MSNSHKIKSIRATGGFLNGVQIEFDDHMNCLIGGRGTGKTTVLEFIRYALGFMPDVRTDPKRFRELEKLISSNLGNEAVEIEIETDMGLRYTIRRKGDNEPGIIKDENGNIKDIDFRRSQIFDAEIYSQNDIENAATNPQYLLNIIDKFREAEIIEIGREISNRRHELDQNAVKILDTKHQLSSLQDDVSEIDGVAERLKALDFDTEEDKSDVSKCSKRVQAVENEQNAVKTLSDELSQSKEELSAWLRNLESLISTTFSSPILSGPDRELFKELYEMCSSSLPEVRQKVEAITEAINALNQETGQVEAKIEGLLLTLNEEYEEVKAKHHEIRDKAEERDRLQRYHAQLVEKQTRYNQLKDDEIKLTDERRDLLAKLSDLYDQRFGIRQEVADFLNKRLSPMIRVQIIPMENPTDYKDLLIEFMKGSQMQYTQVVDKIVNRIPPLELSRLVQNSKVDELIDKLDIDRGRGTKIIVQLQDSRDIFELETVELYDKPLIELKDGDKYKAADSLSTGQKCTTILPILLLESVKPLIIDQPEDNLDNAFVYNTIVPGIRSAKESRQLIFVTHNPNIPVLGDAEKVFVLSSDGQRGTVTSEGSVDEVKSEIETLLEGGKEAFEERRKRYGR